MKNWTISEKIRAGFCVVSILTVAVGLIGFASLKSIHNDADKVLNDYVPSTFYLTQIECHLAEEYGFMERCLRSDDPAEKADVERRISALEGENAELRGSFARLCTRAEDREFMDKLAEPRKRFLDAEKKMMEFCATDDKTSAYAFIKSEYIPAYSSYKTMLDEHVEKSRKETVLEGAAVAGTIRDSKWSILVVVVIALILAVAIAFITVRDINKHLHHVIGEIEESAHELAAAASQVSSASSEQAQGASEQASSLEETSSSLEEISSMTVRNSESARKARELTDSMRAAADASAEQMREMQRAMDAIKASSVGISQIIKTIDEIAFQTNILALNAAVEAARAGESGAGFAVVAGEVRMLAQRSAESAKETGAKIDEAINNSQHGVVISNKVAGSLAEIIEKAHGVHTLVSEIATASGEQDTGIGQLNAAVVEMDKVTQTNASSAEETASAAEELNADAAALKDTVAELVALVRSGGGSGASFMPDGSFSNAQPDRAIKAKAAGTSRNSGKFLTVASGR